MLFEDLHITNFRYCGLWVIEAHDTTLRHSRFKDNTYGNPKGAGEGGGDSGAVQYHRGKNLVIHHNHIEETGNLAPGFGGYALKAQDRKYSVSAENVLEGLRLHDNTLTVPTTGAWENGKAPVIDSGGIGRLFALHEASTYEARNNLFLRTSEAKDIWGTELPGKVSHNFFANITPRGEHAMTGAPGITLVEGDPLPPPYYNLHPDSPLIDKGEILPPWTDGFSGNAPDLGAVERGL